MKKRGKDSFCNGISCKVGYAASLLLDHPQLAGLSLSEQFCWPLICLVPEVFPSGFLPSEWRIPGSRTLVMIHSRAIVALT